MEELAQVYARSLFEVAREQGKLDVLREQLGQFADALDGNRELQVFFFSPYFSTKEKQDGARARARRRRRGVPELPRAADREPPHAGDLPHPPRSTSAVGGGEPLLPVEITSAIELDEADDREPRRTIGERTGRTVTLASARRPRHPRRHRRPGGQLDPRRLDSQPTGAAAQARRPRSLSAATSRSLTPHADQPRRDHQHPQEPHRGARRRTAPS